MSEQKNLKDTQAAPKWAVQRTSGAIVTKIGEAPALEALKPFQFEKARPGEPIHLAVDIIAEPTSRQGKRAFILSPLPGWGNFEIFCDEGTPLGGTDSAPSPLGYFSAGIALCLLTHISMYLASEKLDIDALKIELRAKYQTAAGVNGGNQSSGACEGVETCVIIQTREPSDKIAELIEVCERACMAMQAIANSVPTSTQVILNGEQI